MEENIAKRLVSMCEDGTCIRTIIEDTGIDFLPKAGSTHAYAPTRPLTDSCKKYGLVTKGQDNYNYIAPGVMANKKGLLIKAFTEGLIKYKARSPKNFNKIYHWHCACNNEITKQEDSEVKNNFDNNSEQIKTSEKNLQGKDISNIIKLISTLPVGSRVEIGEYETTIILPNG